MAKKGIDAEIDKVLRIMEANPDTPADTAANLLNQARISGDGPLRQKYLRKAQKIIAEIDPHAEPKKLQALQAQVLALQGRGGDTEIAHVTPGELVIPERMRTPELMAALARAAQQAGIDPRRLVVGSRRNSHNPRTGQAEFADPGNLLSRGYFPYGTPRRPPGYSIEPTPAPTLTAPPPTASDRFWMGVGDPLHATVQNILHVMPKETNEALNRQLGPKLAPTQEQFDKFLQQREQEYVAARQADGQSGIDYPRRIGRMVGSIPADLVNIPVKGGALAAAGMGAATGFVKGMFNEPVTDSEDFAAEKGLQGTEQATKDFILEGLRRWRR